jgi:pSer/pThr/pTyr-binding forkhead associated (FHA) protein
MAVVRNLRPGASPASSPSRFRLLQGPLEIELALGTGYIGRDATCEVSVDDPLASRRHAQVRVDEATVSITDLGSVNGTYVNGERITGTRTLVGGDWITIARQEFQLLDLRSSKPHPGATQSSASPPSSDHDGGRPAVPPASGARTNERPSPPPGSYRAVIPRVPRSNPPNVPPSSSGPSPVTPRSGRSMAREDLFSDDLADEATAQVNTFQLFGKLAEGAFAAQEDTRAEQILSAQFRTILDSARQRGSVAPEAADFVARYAVKLATVTSNAAWLDALFKVFSVTKRPLPEGVVEELGSVLKKFPALDRGALHDYVEVLRAQAGAMSASDRFAVQRIAGLEQILGART